MQVYQRKNSEKCRCFWVSLTVNYFHKKRFITDFWQGPKYTSRYGVERLRFSKFSGRYVSFCIWLYLNCNSVLHSIFCQRFCQPFESSISIKTTAMGSLVNLSFVHLSLFWWTLAGYIRRLGHFQSMLLDLVKKLIMFMSVIDLFFKAQ